MRVNLVVVLAVVSAVVVAAGLAVFGDGETAADMILPTDRHQEMQSPPINIGGVFPHLATLADHFPVRSESGCGALMPWADRLWMVTYVAHLERSGSGTGLFTIDQNLNIQKHPESVVGTFANRMIHAPSNQLIIGPHFIDTDGKVRTAHEIATHRLTATMEHPSDPQHNVLFLTMEGSLFEVDVRTLQARELFNLLSVPELGIRKDGSPKFKPHFKGGYTSNGKVYVANNTYANSDFQGKTADGLLAEWDGQRWKVLSRAPFNEVTGRKGLVFATGWDRASAILMVFADGRWTTYRLPKATHTQDHLITTEWPRIREVESERLLMNVGGMFYELAQYAYDGRVWGVRPISSHLRIIGDFCSWRGLLVVGGNQTTPIWDSNLFAGQPQSNLWFGKTDDLWDFGPRAGWGGPWWDTPVKAGQPSDPYLMTGFAQKGLHLYHDADTIVRFTVEVDVVGNGAWKTYHTFEVPPGGYAHHEFPAGFGAHWVRVTADSDCTATAFLIYL